MFPSRNDFLVFRQCQCHSLVYEMTALSESLKGQSLLHFYRGHSNPHITCMHLSHRIEQHRIEFSSLQLTEIRHNVPQSAIANVPWHHPRQKRKKTSKYDSTGTAPVQVEVRVQVKVCSLTWAQQSPQQRARSGTGAGMPSRDQEQMDR